MILYGAIFSFLLLGVFGGMTATDAVLGNPPTNGQRNGPVSPLSSKWTPAAGLNRTGVVLRDVNNQELTRCGVHSKKTDPKVFVSDGPSGLQCETAGNIKQNSKVVLVPKGDQMTADALKTVAYVERYTLLKHVVEVPWTVTLWDPLNNAICHMQRDTLPKKFKVVIEPDVSDPTKHVCSLDAGKHFLAKTPKDVKSIRLTSRETNMMIVDPTLDVKFPFQTVGSNAADGKATEQFVSIHPFIINAFQRESNGPSSPAKDDRTPYRTQTATVIRNITVQRGGDKASPSYMPTASSNGYWTFIIFPKREGGDSEANWRSKWVYCVYQRGGKQVPSEISLKVNAYGACVAERLTQESMVNKASHIYSIHVSKQLDHKIAGVAAVPPARDGKSHFFGIREKEFKPSAGGGTFSDRRMEYFDTSYGHEQRMK